MSPAKLLLKYNFDMKIVVWMVRGAAFEHFKMDSRETAGSIFEDYYNTTLALIIRYLQNEIELDYTFSDFQSILALEVKKALGRTNGRN